MKYFVVYDDETVLVIKAPINYDKICNNIVFSSVFKFRCVNYAKRNYGRYIYRDLTL